MSQGTVLDFAHAQNIVYPRCEKRGLYNSF